MVVFGEAASPVDRTPSSADALRLAAALDLTDARMTAILQGSWGTHAAILRGISPAQMLLVNPPPGVTSGEAFPSRARARGTVAPGWADAVAIDDGASDAITADSLRASLRGGGRLLAAAGGEIPPGFVKLARDGDVWVAEMDPSAAASPPVTLFRRAAHWTQRESSPTSTTLPMLRVFIAGGTGCVIGRRVVSRVEEARATRSSPRRAAGQDSRDSASSARTR